VRTAHTENLLAEWLGLVGASAAPMKNNCTWRMYNAHDTKCPPLAHATASMIQGSQSHLLSIPVKPPAVITFKYVHHHHVHH
jgi:hypothetical protein